MKHAIFFYLITGLKIAIVVVGIFGLGLIVWTESFGVPCWAFDGGVVNDSITREIIERCGK